MIAANFSIAAGFSPPLAILAGALGGFLAGSATAMVSLKFRISSLLAGIIIVTMVYSINLRIMGRSNIALFQFDNLFDMVWPGMNNTLWQMLLEARASEHSSRMVAMKNATDNAKQLIKDLTLEYNKLRQAAITNELLEITTAKMALE